MKDRILLVDFENGQAVDLKSLPDDVQIKFVLGGKQTSIPTDLAFQAQSLGDRFRYVRIRTVKRNTFR